MSYADNSSMEAKLAPIIRLFEKQIAGRDTLEIAAGTGAWTQVLAKRARSVTATDLNEEMLSIARTKCRDFTNIEFRIADAYALEGLDGSFDAAFAAYWYSHIPKSMIPVFLSSLHKCLRPGARVVFLDMTYRPEFDEEGAVLDDEGNRIGTRTLPDGSVFRVLKNFPTESELRSDLADYASRVDYHEIPELKSWLVSYVSG